MNFAPALPHGDGMKVPAKIKAPGRKRGHQQIRNEKADEEDENDLAETAEASGAAFCGGRRSVHERLRGGILQRRRGEGGVVCAEGAMVTMTVAPSRSEQDPSLRSG